MSAGADQERKGARFRRARRAVGGLLLPRAFGLWSRTWTTEVQGTEHLESSLRSSSILIALWHGNMLLGVRAHAKRNWSVLVSPSDDGDLAESILRRSGYRIVRGSSSRGGARAIRELIAKTRAENQGQTAGQTAIVITPDGPRGPQHSMNLGLAWLSQKTGCPVLPLAGSCDRAYHLNSWDNFSVPKPRAKIRLRYGAPIQVQAGDNLESRTESIRQALLDLEAELQPSPV